ncbi:MAG TPA: hypothetical protein VGM77_06140 [Gemmatimonadales bacterium]
MKSSCSISPGWVGRRFMGRVFAMVIVILALVIVADFDVVGVTSDESEADAPLVIHGNRVLPFPISPERV